MPHLLIGRNNKQLVRGATPWWTLRCYLRGGHALYYNKELGGMWCYDCQAVWHEDPPVDNR